VIAFAQVDRLQDVEIKRILDLPVGVLWRELYIEDRGILRVVRIELAEGLADDLFVGADALEGLTAERRRLFRRNRILVTRASAAEAATRTPAALSARSDTVPMSTDNHA
jgi:hypothetical protein